MELDRLQSRMVSVSEGWLAARRQQFGKTAAALDAMSPLKVLARGYAVATNEKGIIIRSVADASKGEKLRLRVTDGMLHCRVEADDL
jgi:exodeoxyribonuclease VII large subunit